MLAGGISGARQADAQTFRNYGCADGTHFIVAIYDGDKCALLQIDGEPVTLTKRLAVSGARYSGAGITLRIGQDRGHHDQVSEAAGDGLLGDLTPLIRVRIKKGRNLVVSTLFQTSAERMRERGGLKPNTGISVPIWA